jgi:hypothetical protein
MLIRRFMKLHCRYTGITRIHSHSTVTNLDKVVEIGRVDPATKPPCKFTTLHQEYMDLRTNEDLLVFHTVLPRVETANDGPSIDCLYLARNARAKDLSNKISICPSAWWWHLFKACGYNKRTAHSLLDCFEMDATYVADQSTFKPATGVVTTQFANGDDFLDRMEDELGSDLDNASEEKSEGGSPCVKSTFEISANAKASLESALGNPDMDHAVNSHASAKSRWTSMGNSTNQSVNTRQFALTHKSRALALAMETKCAADLENKNNAMAICLQQLQSILARGTPPSKHGPHHPLNLTPTPTLAPQQTRTVFNLADSDKTSCSYNSSDDSKPNAELIAKPSNISPSIPNTSVPSRICRTTPAKGARRDDVLAGGI